ncbi:hypothetical protein EHO61_04810 [Leptospira fluminis]|uniref:Uncharacterized protein n=2 Tax=Leptospira TaxID=171 RepID=A0A4R9GSK5_9LEPT|nr:MULTISPECIES: hypothetical protein [Leptospira]TGK11685.1 hypothetical protein EHO60_05160 [Leptospira fletcheri]TGK21174.1 hypothetical protein EHO61_04810 [Leptospira fluminis]
MSVVSSIKLGLQEKNSLDNRKLPKVEGLMNEPYENKQANTNDRKATSLDYTGDMYKVKGAFIDKIA